MGVPAAINTPVHWHVGMSIDDPNVVRELEALGVRSGSRQAHEVPPDLVWALQAIGVADSRVGIHVDDPDLVRALEALSGPVESNHAYEVGPPIRWPQQVSRPAAQPPPPLAAISHVVGGMLPPRALRRRPGGGFVVAADRRERARGVTESVAAQGVRAHASPRRGLQVEVAGDARRRRTGLPAVARQHGGVSPERGAPRS